MIGKDLSKQPLDADPKTIQKISFTANMNPCINVNENRIMFFIIEETKEPILGISKGAVKVL